MRDYLFGQVVMTYNRANDTPYSLWFYKKGKIKEVLNFSNVKDLKAFTDGYYKIAPNQHLKKQMRCICRRYVGRNFYQWNEQDRQQN